jgi:serine phosphatase RsbU (regulator of sigma subunit)
LQRALLPAVLSEVPGAEVAARYLPGVQGMEVGGDWYDVIPYGEGRSLIVVGDVSGKGLNAAAAMASLRFATRAYAGQGDSSVEILTKLSVLMSAEPTDNFATVLCIGLDVGAREMTLANAGHLPPFLMNGSEGSFVSTPVGVPVGVAATRPYEATTVTLPDHGTLVAYTDGLIERRDESLDTSLERLRTAAVRQEDRAPEALLTALVRDLVGHGEDDTAILAVTWPN